MYWLRKMVLTRLVGDNVDGHISEMQKTYNHLSSLITPDHIFATSLLISLPSDWISCVSNLLQNPTTSSTTIVNTLKAEALWRRSSAFTDHSPVELASSVATSSAKESHSSKARPCCSFFKRLGHTKDSFWSLQSLMHTHPSLINDHLHSTLPSGSSPSPAPSSKKKKKGRKGKASVEKVSPTSIVESGEEASEYEHSCSAARLVSSSLHQSHSASLHAPDAC